MDTRHKIALLIAVAVAVLLMLWAQRVPEHNDTPVRPAPESAPSAH